MILIFVFVCGFVAGCASLLAWAMFMTAAKADRRMDALDYRER